MFPTRRAPFVCLGLWPTKPANLYFPGHRDQIGLADTGHNLDESMHKKLWTKTEASTKAALSPFGICSKQARKATFRLPDSLRAELVVVTEK